MKNLKKAGVRVAAGIMIAVMAVSSTACKPKEEEEFVPVVDTEVTDFGGDFDSETGIYDLTTNNMDNPVGLDERPSFAWTMQSNRIGARQKAYRLTLKEVGGGQVWDSGRTESNLCTDIVLPDTVSVQPETDYEWTVCVWDEKDNEYTASSGFTTGLLDPSIDAWQDENGNRAQWIGSETPSVQADLVDYYQISCDFTLGQVGGDKKLGFVFGANDPRLNHAIYNNALISGENYLYLQIDLSASTPEISAVRKGYDRADGEGTVVFREELGVNPDDGAAHSLCMKIGQGGLDYLAVDDFVVFNNKTTPQRLAAQSDTSKTYPCLNDVGFYSAGVSYNVENYRISNYFRNDDSFEPAVLFGEGVGAGVEKFGEIEGVSVDGGVIEVSGDVFGYVDPSYGGATYLRKTFNATKTVEKARLYVTSRGVYEYYINGERVTSGKEYCRDGDDVYTEDYFNPGSDEYWRTMRYSVYDVTDKITAGRNAVGAIVSSGWWCDSITYIGENRNFYGENYALLSMLKIEYSDGSTSTVLSDNTWKYSVDVPIVYSGFFHGEYYDATKESLTEGWTSADFNAENWKDACDVEPRPDVPKTPQLLGMVGTSAHVFEVLPGKFDGAETRDDGEGTQTVYYFDMGVNMVGIPEVEFGTALPAGTEVVFRYGEIKYPASDGRLGGLILTENLRTARATDRYIAAGETGESYSPSFTFHGYRYMEVGFPALDKAASDKIVENMRVKGLVLCSLNGITAEYESSDATVNQLFANITRSTIGNHLALPTDCNQRDERQGWTGDAAAFSDTAVYISDMNEIYSSFARSMADGASKSRAGTVTVTSPSYDNRNFTEAEYDEHAEPDNDYGLCWAQGYIRSGYSVFRQTGDESIIRENWTGYCRMMDAYAAHPLKGFSYIPDSDTATGDWLAPVTTSTKYMEIAVYGKCLAEMVEMARAVGTESDIQRYTERLDGFRKEFTEKILDENGIPHIGTAKVSTQTGYALALAYDLVNPEKIEAVVNQYLTKCGKGALNSGFMGSGAILPALSKNGQNEAAYKLFESREYPSWLYPVTQGATSIWERLNSYTEKDGFGGNNSMNSFNHYSFGAVGSWMMEYQVGISAGDEAGYYEFVLQPTPGGSFTSVNGAYDSHLGKVTSGWKASGGELTEYSCTVPANAVATLYLPVAARSVNGMKLTAGMQFVGMETHNGIKTAVFKLQAGAYSFKVDGGALSAKIDGAYTVR